MGERRGRSVGRRLAAAVLSCAVAFSLLLPLSAEPQRRDADLDNLRAEISRLRKTLSGVRTRARTTEEELEALQLELAISTRELEVAVAVERSLVDERSTTEAQIAALTSSLERQRKYIARRVAALYKLGSLSYLRILLSLNRNANPFEAAAMLSYVINRDSRAVAEIEASRQALAVRQVELTTKESRIAAARAALEQRQGDVERTRAAKENFLARLRAEDTLSSQKLAALEEKAKRLENLFSLLYEHNDPRSLSGANIADYQGALEWPVKGAVLESFGLQRNRKFATVTVSNGIKIESGAGTSVRAVFQGTVLYAQWFKGYGNLIILDHGNRIFSLYGNTSNPRVAVGDRVSPRQVIADVGQDEDGQAGYLYFEIREDNKPTDPRKWLR